jgi:hypothetical protein
MGSMVETTRRTMRRARHVAIAVVLTGAVTGCGVVDDLRASDFSKQSGADIVTAASAAMADVTSMPVTGQTRSDGSPVFVDLTLGEDTCTGTIRYDRSRVTLLRIGDRAWFRGDDATFRRLAGRPLPGGGATGSGSWVRADELADEGFCDLAGLLSSFSLEPPAPGAKGAAAAEGMQDRRAWTDLGDLAVGEEVDLDGGRAVEVTSTPTDSAWISSSAPHHVVRLESTSPREGGSLSYTEFNQDVVVEAPRGKDVVRP